MYEHPNQELLPMTQFLIRLGKSILIGLIMITAALFMGMMGYHVFEGMAWIDAFANAAMILSGMGPLGPLATWNGKLFAGMYALFSGLAFIIIMSVIFSPVIHRVLHKFHLQHTSKTDS